MLKLLAKKSKSNKGFTLIELIVVIAIIAILALLLVPRFAGFTEDARVSNDRNACETIERAFMTLVANGTIRVTPASPAVDGTCTINLAGVWAPTNIQIRDLTIAAGWDTITAAEIEDEIEDLTGDLEIQARTVHTAGWSVTLTPDGEVTCTVS